MIDMFEEYGYDLFDNPSLVRDIELQVSEVSCECDGFYICSEHTQQQGMPVDNFQTAVRFILFVL